MSTFLDILKNITTTETWINSIITQKGICNMKILKNKL